ncbi:MAG: hypothetical protein AB1679_23290 [Actinomycetota bacterium]
MRRALVPVATLVLVVGRAGPAAAHGVGGFSSSNLRSELKSVQPPIPGLEVRVIESGSRLEVENRTGEDAVVIGYENEPYLRVGPDGVFENRRSPATYLNSDRRGRTTVPATADPKAAPEWRKIASQPVARWHDHRVHWMGDQNPPAVRRAPGETHVIIPNWVVPIRHGSTTIEARGDLRWIPGSSPVPWLVIAGLLLAATVAAFRRRPSGPAIAVAAGLLLTLDVVHALGTSFAVTAPASDQLARALTSSVISPVAWILGGVGVWMLLTSRPGLPLVAGAAAIVALSGGLADLADLSRSQIPFAWSAPAARLLVATSLGAGLGLAVACLLAAANPGTCAGQKTGLSSP